MKKIIVIFSCVFISSIQAMELIKTDNNVKKEVPSLKTLCIKAISSDKYIIDSQTLPVLLSTYCLSFPPDVTEQLVHAGAKKLCQPKTLKLLQQNLHLLCNIDEQAEPAKQLAKKIIEMSPCFRMQKFEQPVIKLMDNRERVYVVCFSSDGSELYAVSFDRLNGKELDFAYGGISKDLVSRYQCLDSTRIALVEQFEPTANEISQVLSNKARKEQLTGQNLMNALNREISKIDSKNYKLAHTYSSSYIGDITTFSKNNNYYAFAVHFLQEVPDAEHENKVTHRNWGHRIYVFDCSDINNIICAKEITDPSYQVEMLAFSPDENYLVSVSRGWLCCSSVNMYDCTQAKNGDVPLIKHIRLGSRVNSIDFSPNSSYFALAGYENTVYLYPLKYENLTLTEVLALLIQEESLGALTNPELESIYKDLSKKIELPRGKQALLTGAQWLRDAKAALQNICGCKNFSD